MTQDIESSCKVARHEFESDTLYDPILLFVARWICWDVLHHICHKIWAPKVEAGKSFERFNLRPFGSGFTFLLQDSANIWRKKSK